MKRFIAGESRTQSTLLPEMLDDYVAGSNPVRVVDVFVDELDLGKLGFEGVDPAATGRPGYLSDLDTADRQEPVVAKLRTERLQDKITALKEQMKALKEIEVQLEATPDKQIPSGHGAPKRRYCPRWKNCPSASYRTARWARLS
jgi:hypothetical protein